MPLGRSVINDQVLPFDPAMIAHAVQPHLEERQVFRVEIKIADPARRPLCPRTLWRNEQCRSTRYEIPPIHSILITGRGRWNNLITFSMGPRTKREHPSGLGTMSALGHKRTFRHLRAMSVLPPKADMDQHGRDVR